MSTSIYDDPNWRKRPRGPRKHVGRAPKYPWHEWSKPGKHTVTQGVDFDCSIPSFTALLHGKLRSPRRPKGFPEGADITFVETSTKDNTVTFEYHYVEYGEFGDH